LRSGSPSNLRVRFSRRTAESRYLPRPRVSPAGRGPAATEARRGNSPRLSVGVTPVLPSSTSPLLPMILTHTLPLCSEINRRGCAREPSERCDAQHHILPGFSVLPPRAQISETERRITALVCGFTPHSYSRCYKRKCKKNTAEPSSRNEIEVIRSRHLTSWRS